MWCCLDFVENVVCFLCFSDLLQLACSGWQNLYGLFGEDYCVVSDVSICGVWVTSWCSWQGIGCDLVLAYNMDDSCFVPHETQSEALDARWHLVEFHWERSAACGWFPQWTGSPSQSLNLYRSRSLLVLFQQLHSSLCRWGSRSWSRLTVMNHCLKSAVGQP